jgi:hypothetical protein
MIKLVILVLLIPQLAFAFGDSSSRSSSSSEVSVDAVEDKTKLSKKFATFEELAIDCGYIDLLSSVKISEMYPTRADIVTKYKSFYVLVPNATKAKDVIDSLKKQCK